MWTSAAIAVALVATVAGVCHKHEMRYYSELGCEPGPPGVDGCPTSYKCGARSPDQCQYRGAVYSEGHKLNLTADCLADCVCSTSPLNNKTAFFCVGIECPELFNRPPPPNCYRIYEHGKCCKVDEVCVDPMDQNTRPVCQYKGFIFEIGQKFYIDEECKQCICQPGYNGSYEEPFCRKITCNLELLYGYYMTEGCVPVFHGERDCCPLGWRCPEPTDVVMRKEDKKDHADSVGETCQFGGVRMQVGDVLNPSDLWPGTHCECRVPPHPLCVQDPAE